MVHAVAARELRAVTGMAVEELQDPRDLPVAPRGIQPLVIGHGIEEPDPLAVGQGVGAALHRLLARPRHAPGPVLDHTHCAQSAPPAPRRVTRR